MRSATYKKLVNMIRVRKECIESELSHRIFDSWRGVTEIMCATWFIRGHIEKMFENLHDKYWECESDLSRREYEALYMYIDKLENYYWNLLYDKGNEINTILLERRNAQ